MNTVKIRAKDRLIICQAGSYSPAMQNLLQDLDRHIDAGVLLKNDRTSTVALISLEDRPLIIKRANTKGAWHFLRRSMARSRASKNWRNALILHQRGIPTFSPVALLEERFGPFKGRSYFIGSHIAGIPAVHYFRDETITPIQQRAAATQIVRMILALREKLVSHRDLNLSNIILQGTQPWLVDLEAMRCHRFFLSAKINARREWNRFMQNCWETPGISPQIPALFQEIIRELNIKHKECQKINLC